MNINNIGFLKFGNILNGISKTLNFVNQAIPIYNKAKPLFINSKKIIESFNLSDILPKINSNKIVSSKTKSIKKTDNTNSPVFFN